MAMCAKCGRRGATPRRGFLRFAVREWSACVRCDNWFGNNGARVWNEYRDRQEIAHLLGARLEARRVLREERRLRTVAIFRYRRVMVARRVGCPLDTQAVVDVGYLPTRNCGAVPEVRVNGTPRLRRLPDAPVPDTAVVHFGNSGGFGPSGYEGPRVTMCGLFEGPGVHFSEPGRGGYCPGCVAERYLRHGESGWRAPQVRRLPAGWIERRREQQRARWREWLESREREEERRRVARFAIGRPRNARTARRRP